MGKAPRLHQIQSSEKTYCKASWKQMARLYGGLCLEESCRERRLRAGIAFCLGSDLSWKGTNSQLLHGFQHGGTEQTQP